MNFGDGTAGLVKYTALTYPSSGTPKSEVTKVPEPALSPSTGHRPTALGHRPTALGLRINVAEGMEIGPTGCSD